MKRLSDTRTDVVSFTDCEEPSPVLTVEGIVTSWLPVKENLFLVSALASLFVGNRLIARKDMSWRLLSLPTYIFT
jgi:hypothetical protein